jgi:hypothetical protein
MKIKLKIKNKNAGELTSFSIFSYISLEYTFSLPLRSRMRMILTYNRFSQIQLKKPKKVRNHIILFIM